MFKNTSGFPSEGRLGKSLERGKPQSTDREQKETEPFRDAVSSCAREMQMGKEEKNKLLSLFRRWGENQSMGGPGSPSRPHFRKKEVSFQ